MTKSFSWLQGRTASSAASTLLTLPPTPLLTLPWIFLTASLLPRPATVPSSCPTPFTLSHYHTTHLLTPLPTLPLKFLIVSLWPRLAIPHPSQPKTFHTIPLSHNHTTHLLTPWPTLPWKFSIASLLPKCLRPETRGA